MRLARKLGPVSNPAPIVVLGCDEVPARVIRELDADVLSRCRLTWWNHVMGYPAGLRTVLGCYTMAIPAVSGTNQG